MPRGMHRLALLGEDHYLTDVIVVYLAALVPADPRRNRGSRAPIASTTIRMRPYAITTQPEPPARRS